MLTYSIKSWRLLALGLAFAALPMQASAVETSVLEEYIITHKGDPGLTASLQDEKLGDTGGMASAKCKIDYVSKTNSNLLKIKVWRAKSNTPIGLTFDVIIKAYNSLGAEIYNDPRAGKMFGSNNSGKWEYSTDKIRGAATIKVTFTGYYK